MTLMSYGTRFCRTTQMTSRLRRVSTGAAALGMLALLGCSSSTESAGEDAAAFKACFPVTVEGERACDPSRVTFSLASKNRYYPLFPGSVVVLEGTEDGELVRVERRVLDDLQVVAGVTTHVLEAKEFKNGKLYEIARNFYVESDDGDVCYFGEDVAFYENDKVVNNDGTWRAGVNGAKPGLIMPTNPTVDQAYYQENSPGVAQDMARVAAIDGTETLAGVTYRQTVLVKDGNPLDACEKIEDKLYLPGVGEAGDTVKRLVSFVEAPVKACHPPTLDATACDPRTGTFSLASTNRYYPLRIGDTTVLEGSEDSEKIRVERRVLPALEVVDGVTTHVLEARELKNGKLYEVARNYYVEATGGTVCYFGEDVDFYADDGVTIVNHNGSWRAGFGGAKPGIIMPAQPAVGQAYFQEQAPGIARDMGLVAGTTATVAAGGMTYTNVVTIKDSNPLVTCAEEDKLYAPGVGEAGDTVKKLVSFTAGP